MKKKRREREKEEKEKEKINVRLRFTRVPALSNAWTDISQDLR